MNSTMPSEQEIIYSIDEKDHLCSVSAEWVAFAMANDGTAVLPGRVLGRSLWEFIEDANVRELYRQMIHRVRSGYQAQFDYRCDAPEWRRRFRMTIRMASEGRVVFLSQLIWREVRARVDILDLNKPRCEGWVRVCSWCQKVVLPEGLWVPVEEAVEKLGLLAEEAMPRLTHGICPPCHLGMMQQLAPLADVPRHDIPSPTQATEIPPPDPERRIFKQ